MEGTIRSAVGQAPDSGEDILPVDFAAGFIDTFNYTQEKASNLFRRIDIDSSNVVEYDELQHAVGEFGIIFLGRMIKMT